MDNRRVVALGLLCGAAYFWLRSRNAANTDQGTDTGMAGTVADMATQVEDAVNAVTAGLTPYQLAILLPGNAAYVARCQAVEAAYGLPDGMLSRLAWQECRFRADIIEGRKVSSAGAKGMFQLMPLHWKYVDPLDWSAAADYTGAMLVRLYKRFGAWDMALAAYNWGEGNLNSKGLAAAPTETRNYYAQIMADIGLGVVA